jgi:hypothetical protein
VPGLCVRGCQGEEREGQDETRGHSCQDSCHLDDGIRTIVREDGVFTVNNSVS